MAGGVVRRSCCGDDVVDNSTKTGLRYPLRHRGRVQDIKVIPRTI